MGLLTSRVNGHAGDPFGVGLQFLGHFLFDEVVDPDGALRRHKEVGPDRVEGYALNQPFVPPERVLAPPPAQLVDEDLQVAGVIRHHRSQVVSFGVPRHLVDVLQKPTLVSPPTPGTASPEVKRTVPLTLG